MIWTTRPRSDLGTIAAITAGDGPTILLIHGVGLRAEAWAPQIDALSATHRVIAVDMPGHGHSAALPATARLTDFSDAIAAAFTGPFVAVGHSFGAMIALDLAARMPARVTAVAALNAIYRRSAPAKTAVQTRAAALDGRTHADPATPLDRWFGPTPSNARDACERWLRSADPQGYKTAYGVFAHHDGPADAALRGLPMPAVFMTGALEPNSTPAMSRAMADTAPQGQARIIAGAAHMMPMTHATDVTEILLNFAR